MLGVTAGETADVWGNDRPDAYVCDGNPDVSVVMEDRHHSCVTIGHFVSLFSVSVSACQHLSGQRIFSHPLVVRSIVRAGRTSSSGTYLPEASSPSAAASGRQQAHHHLATFQRALPVIRGEALLRQRSIPLTLPQHLA